jgi:hypothetical protein
MSSSPHQNEPEAPPGAPVGQEYPFDLSMRRHSLIAAMMRGALVLLAVVVAGGFILILLPQNSLERLAHTLRLRNSAEPVQEKIAFIYLGDEVQGKDFHIRGVVRNISTAPIEKLDAAVRLYSHDNRLLETRVVRMDSETISPDGIAQFNLTFPDYGGQFSSYSVEFMSREGKPVPYKDIRRARGQN